jgi:lipopolysaccharide export system protein LptA
MCLALIPVAFYASIANALKSDKEQPIYIDSNSATYDDKKGISIYTGKVFVRQGSMELRSDKLVVYLKNREVKRLVATGEEVHFKQTPGPGEKDVKGRSKKAEYLVEKDQLILTNEAVIWQNNDTYASDLIIYNNSSGTVEAGEKYSDSKRVSVVLQPREKNKIENGQDSSKAAQ